jgi:hypothetical protein
MLVAALQIFQTDLMRLTSEWKEKNSDSLLPAAAAVSPSGLAKSPTTAVSPNVPTNSPPAVPSVSAQPVRLDSTMVRNYPPLFEEFRMKRWLFLWRGSREHSDTHFGQKGGMCSAASRRWSGIQPHGIRGMTACKVSSSR